MSESREHDALNQIRRSVVLARAMYERFQTEDLLPLDRVARQAGALESHLAEVERVLADYDAGSIR